MIRRPPWVVLVPGDKAWVEERVRQYFAEEEPDRPVYSFHPGTGRYQAVYGTDRITIGTEGPLAEELSGEREEPVYAMDFGADEPLVLAFRNRACVVEETDPDDLARALGCPLPETPEVRRVFPVLRSVAVIDSLSADRARQTLEKERGRPLPSDYHFEETPKGLLIYNDSGDIGFTANTISEQFPAATGYSVMASQALDEFTVLVWRAGECAAHYDVPPRHDPDCPAVAEIRNENSPERILEALGIPARLFRG